MSEKFNFSIHSVNVIPEHAIYLKGEGNGLDLVRTGNGYFIRQRAGTSDWFHFAIVSPKKLDGGPSHLRSVFLDSALAGITTLDIIRIHQAGSRGGNPPSSQSFCASDIPESGLVVHNIGNRRGGQIGGLPLGTIQKLVSKANDYPGFFGYAKLH